jgi:Uncharacterised nucleotidyltransferase
VPPILDHELLLRAITQSGAEAAKAYAVWRPTVDFSGPIDPETTALLPQLHEALLALGLEDPLMGVFKGICRRAWYENQTLLASAEQVLVHLGDADIANILVGEIPLAVTYYKSLYARRIGQIDIVVAPRQLRAAFAVLADSGWNPDGPLADEEIAYRHAKRFAGAGDRTLYLHWHFSGPAANAAADEFFRSEIRPCLLHDRQARQLSPTAMLLHWLLAEAPVFGAMPALWVADARAIMAEAGHEVDWARIAAFGVEERLTARLEQKLRLLGQFGVAIPDRATGLLRQAPASVPDVIDKIVLRGPDRRRRRKAADKWGVLADYLRSDRRQGLAHGMSDLSHFVRHRWGLRGRREILPVIARYIWRGRGPG